MGVLDVVWQHLNENRDAVKITGDMMNDYITDETIVHYMSSLRNNVL